MIIQRVSISLFLQPPLLNQLFDYSQANLSQHLKILREAGILENRKIGVEMHYSVKLKGIEKLLAAIDLTAAEYFSTLEF